jgi:ribokinase
MNKKILNIGSINIDYVYRVPHCVQPGETLSSSSLDVFPGGKGLNQSVALARAGGQVFHAGKVGPDGLGMVEVLKKSGVDSSLVDRFGSATGHAIIQVDSAGQNCIILHKGANHEIDRPLIDGALSGFGEGDFLVLQNEVSGIEHAMRGAAGRGMKIAFNLAPFSPEILAYPLELVDFFLVNEIEGRGVSGKFETTEVLDEIAARYPKSSVILTLGQDGVVHRDGRGTLSHGIYDVPVADTTAAGDTFIGFFISSIVNDIATDEALRRASVASSIAVSRNGASSSVPTLDEVLAADLAYIEPNRQQP